MNLQLITKKLFFKLIVFPLTLVEHILDAIASVSLKIYPTLMDVSRFIVGMICYKQKILPSIYTEREFLSNFYMMVLGTVQLVCNVFHNNSILYDKCFIAIRHINLLLFSMPETWKNFQIRLSSSYSEKHLKFRFNCSINLN